MGVVIDGRRVASRQATRTGARRGRILRVQGKKLSEPRAAMLVSAGAVDNWRHAVRGLQQRCLVVKLDAAPFPLYYYSAMGIEQKGILASCGGCRELSWRLVRFALTETDGGNVIVSVPRACR